jgi:hypothetical protein
VTHQLNKWRNNQWSGTLESLDPAVEHETAGDDSSYSATSLVTAGGIALSDSEKAGALADNLEAHFQAVDDTSYPAVIEMADEALQV